jgi:NADPH2:quinone reductase
MFLNLRLPSPLAPAEKELPLLVYGASTAVGAFAVKLAKLANIHPIIGVAGSGSGFAKEIGCDIVIDHRQGDVVANIKKALNGKPLLHALDGVSEEQTAKDCFQALSQGGQHVYFSDTAEPPSGITTTRTMVSYAQEGPLDQQDVATAYLRLLTKWLGEGRYTAHPYEVVPGGLAGVESGVTRLYENRVSAKKLVYRIAETPGL